jgi:hypothetical protein
MNGKKARQIRQAKAGDVTWVPELGGYVHSDAVEAASVRDRAYFEAHPGAEWYVRERMDCEFPDKCSPTFTATLVRQFRPGARSRQPITEQSARELEAARLAGIDVQFFDGKQG